MKLRLKEKIKSNLRSAINTIKFHFLPAPSFLHPPGSVLPDWFMFIQCRRDARVLHLKVHFIAELILIPEHGFSCAGVSVIHALVESSYVREPQVAFGV